MNEILANPYLASFWLEYQLNPQRLDYNIVFDQQITGSLDTEKLSQAFKKLIDDNFIFQCSLIKKGQDLYWKQQSHPICLQIFDSCYSENEFVSKPFVLERGPLCRIGLFKVADEHYNLIIVFHHVLIDGTKVTQLLEALSHNYNNTGQTPPSLQQQQSALITQYKRYQQKLVACKNNEAVKYWQQYLADAPKINSLPYGSSESARRFNNQRFKIEKDNISQSNTSNFNFLLLTWAIIMARYCNQDITTIRYPRSLNKNSSIYLGAEINSLVAKINLEDVKQFSVLLESHNQHLSFLRNKKHCEHAALPINQVVKATSIACLNIGFAESELKNTTLQFEKCQTRILNRFDLHIGNAEISLSFQEMSSAFEFNLIYRTDLFTEQQIALLIQHYDKLTTLISHSDHLNINYLTSAEKNLSLSKLPSAYQPKYNFLNAFSKSVTNHPSRTALVHNDQTMTYQELNEKSNQLARYLQQRSQPGDIIALCLTPCCDMLVAILAIFKARCAYLPLDPDYPEQRLAHLLQETNAPIVLTFKPFVGTINALSKAQAVALDETPHKRETTEALTTVSQADELAYVIFTSGTTGKPKGVMVTHEALSFYLHSFLTLIDDELPLVSQLSLSYCFDGAIPLLFGPLLSGGRLIFTPSFKEMNIVDYINLLEAQQINFVKLTPTLLTTLQTGLTRYPKALTIMLGGEALNLPVVNALSQNPHLTFYNQYGPTENVVGSTYYKVDTELHRQIIGQPYPGKRIYILDKHLNPVPKHVVGELYIGGRGLANGYLNQPELTQQHFLANPFIKNETFYKTGDLAKWLDDGNIEYQGRYDQQVKLHGYRIELNEISQQLTQYDTITDCTVQLITHQYYEYLAAYYVGATTIEPDKLREFLQSHLPFYMVPNHFVLLEALPLTTNGKLDTAALPKPEFTGKVYVAPRNTTEEQLCILWQTALQIDKVGIEDDFFALGGHSLLAIQVTHKMSEFLQQDIRVNDIFSYRTIVAIVANANNQRITIEPFEGEHAPLSFAQQRLYFLQCFEPGNTAYHIPYLCELNDTCEQAALEKSMLAIIKRHSIFRTTLHQDEKGDSYQKVGEQPVTIEYKQINMNELSALINRPFNLSEQYPVRIFMLSTLNNKRYLLCVFHHVAFDGWSKSIFVNELVAFYQYYTKQQAHNLPSSTLQYQDYAAWQHHYLRSDVLQKQSTFWERTLQDSNDFKLPTDKPRPKSIDYHGETYHFEIDPSTSESLKQIAKKKSVSTFTLLLSGLYILLNKYSQDENIIVGTPIANRQFDQVKNMIGLFVNTLVLKATLTHKMTIDDVINQTQHYLENAQNHQDLPFDKLLEILHVKRLPDRHPLFQIMFTVSQEEEKDSNQPWCLIPIREHYKVAKFDLSFHIHQTEELWQASINFATALYEKNTIIHLAQHYCNILAQISCSTTSKVQDFNLLTTQERKKLLYTNNQTEEDFDRQLTLPQLFAQSVAKGPNNVALLFKDKTLTYRQLDEKSNQLARHIRHVYQQKQDLNSLGDVLIPLCVDRSFDTVIGILGILKSGAAYVPIDPNTPQLRTNCILQDTKANLAVIHTNLTNKFTEIANLIAIDSDEYSHCSKEALSLSCLATNLAYVIYTSGTTGEPKGVMIEHINVVNFVLGLLKIPGYKRYIHTTALQTSLCFDVSVEEIWTSLASNKRLWVVDKECLLSRDVYNERLKTYNVSMLTAIPSWLAQMQLTLHDTKTMLNIGGEALPLSLANQYIKQATICNLYGPTEATVTVTYKHYPKSKPIEQISIGKPTSNIKLYVLDKHLQPVPIGVPGELYISGLCLARGYLNRPELTDKVFIPNPFTSATDYKTMYKTGDQVRWLSNGELECLGRIDDQVKIAGHRIELDEIKSILLTLEHIKYSVVTIDENEDQKYIIAYYTATKNLNEKELKQQLQKILPVHMLPHRLIALQSIPLNITGKLDRTKLPSPFKQEVSISNPQLARPLKDQIKSLWLKILPYKNIQYQDKFFEVGGTSLLAMKFCALLERQLSIKLPIARFFQYPSIEELAHYLSPEKAPTSDAASFTRSEKLTNDIAIIGLATRTTGANNHTEFWQNLCEGVESIIDFTEEELRKEGISPQLLADDNYIKRSGFIKSYKEFDPEFFDITPNEALATDPQHRHLQECVWEALENAGIVPKTCPYKIGLYASQAKSNYYEKHVKGNNKLLSSLGRYQLDLLNGLDFIATKISYRLGLTGPSLAIQTGCSSSLVSVDTAVSHLRAGKCQIAIAGAVRFKGKGGYLYQPNMISAKDGHCRAFDKEASGTISGEAVGAIILKPLELALQDNDHIYAVIKGSATNNDASRKVGYTAPSVNGQAEVINLALQDANIDPASITYVEAHGTGTHIGDPIEIAALSQAYRQYTLNNQYCAIASLKTNIGHTDTAAGLMGLIKTTLALHHKKIPASINFKEANPKIDFANSPFYVNAKLQDWANLTHEKRRAAVSSFGIGGTNAHVVLEEAPCVLREPPKLELQILPISARNSQSLSAQQKQLAEYLHKNASINLADIAFTLQQGRKAFEQRSFIVASTIEDAIKKLSNIPSPVKINASSKTKVVFMFPGQGAQYIDMAKNLYEQQAVFKAIVDRSAKYLSCHENIDILKILYPEHTVSNDEQQLKQTQYAQPALFVIEYALAEQLMAWGIKPDIVIGHSLGEYVAATIAETFTLEDALHLVASRGRLMQSAPAGNMLSIGQCVEEVRNILPDDICVAAINCPQSCVISGTDKSIQSIQAQLSTQKIENTLLETSHAFHSDMMKNSAQAFKDIIAKINKKTPKVPIITNLTGDYNDTDITTDDYWLNQLLNPVQFKQSIATLLEEDNICCLEVGPGHALTTLTLRNSKAKSAPQTINCMHNAKNSTQDDNVKLMQAIGELWQANVEINWKALHTNNKPRKTPLPTYCFKHKEYWLEKQASAADSKTSISNNYHDYFYRPIWKTACDTQIDSDLIAKEDNYTLIFSNEKSLEVLSTLFSMENKIIILPGNIFTKLSKNKYSINYSKKDDFLNLFSSLRSLPIKHIIYANKSCQVTGVAMTQMAASQLFMELLCLSQAAISHFEQQSLCLTIITNQLYSVTGETNQPELSMVYGPLKVLPQEHPNFSSKLLDISLDENTLNPDIAAKISHDLIHQQDVTEIVYRHGQRWQRDFEQIKKLTPLISEENNHATYLITGGLGGIGLSYALHLSQHLSDVNLILFSRRTLQPKSQWRTLANGADQQAILYSNLISIEKAASSLQIYPVDIALANSCEKTFEKIYNKHTTIDYVIHCAGVPAGGIIANKTLEMVQKTFAPKIAGTMNLAKHLKHDTIKHFILCSSLNAITGGQSQVDYVAANAFLDSFAPYFQNKTSIKTTSINWLRWNSVGMAETTKTPLAMQNKRLQARKHGVEPSVGCAMLETIINTSYSQILTSKTKISAQLVKPEANVHSKSNADILDNIPMIEKLRHIWQDAFGIKKIHDTDDFFALGGHSLLAIQVAHQMTYQTGMTITVADIFKYKTINQILEHKNESTLITINRCKLKIKMPLSLDQIYRWEYECQHPRTTVNHIPSVFQLTSAVKLNSFNQSIQAVIQRHSILRTTIHTDKSGTYYQTIHNSPLTIKTLRCSDNNLESMIIAEKMTPFDLQSQFPVRATMIETKTKRFVVFVLHHIAYDEWSHKIFIRDLIDYYAYFTQNKINTPSELPFQYYDYANWQLTQLSQQAAQQAKKFWLEKLCDYQILKLPSDKKITTNNDMEAAYVKKHLSQELTSQISHFCQQHKTSIYTFLLSAYYLLLREYCQQESIMIGTMTANRPYTGMEDQIGAYACPLLLITNIAKHNTLPKLLSDTYTHLVQMQNYQYYPIFKITEHLGLNNNIHQRELYNATFYYQENYKIDKIASILQPSSLGAMKTTAKFQLSLFTTFDGDKIGLNLRYVESLYYKKSMQNLLKRYVEIIACLLENPQQPF